MVLLIIDIGSMLMVRGPPVILVSLHQKLIILVVHGKTKVVIPT